MIRPKYNNTKTEFMGIKFDSRKEANHYALLLQLKKQGFVKEIELQPVFELQPKFKYQGKTIRAIKYISDFRITWADGTVTIEDTKGFKTEIYKLKKKMFQYKFPDWEIKEI